MTRFMKLAWILLLCGCGAGDAFPRDFLFGTAIAGFQVEMGCPTLPAAACEDLDRAAHELHSNALRLSIEWSRVFPVSTIGVADLRPVASASALAYYHALFAAMSARGREDADSAAQGDRRARRRVTDAQGSLRSRHAGYPDGRG
jgi:hypothetical protein